MPADDFQLDVDQLDAGPADNYQRPLRLRSQRAYTLAAGGGGYYREPYTVGDTAPDLRAQCMDGSGAPVPLVGATGRLHVAGQFMGDVSFVDAATGVWSYQFSGTDLDTPGEYAFELRITLTSGSVMTFPSNESDRPVIVLRPNLALVT